nr:MAG TPA: hypothetical protein [Caudoviricetes sp.]
MKCKQIKYFEYDGEYFVAEDKESCINLISTTYEIESEEIAKYVNEVSENTELDSFVVEGLMSLGFSDSVYAEFHYVSLKEIYTLIYHLEAKLPLQIVYQG